MTGESFRRRRRLCDLSQQELADRAQVSIRTVQRFESGQGVPLPVVLAQLERVLDEAEADMADAS